MGSWPNDSIDSREASSIKIKHKLEEANRPFGPSSVKKSSIMEACFENESFETKETTSSKLRNKLEEAKRIFDPAAKKALDFNLKCTDKFDREKNEDVKEPQKSTNRIKKKPWPLPSGTTPYMKKDRITFKQSGEKEK